MLLLFESANQMGTVAGRTSSYFMIYSNTDQKAIPTEN